MDFIKVVLHCQSFHSNNLKLGLFGQLAGNSLGRRKINCFDGQTVRQKSEHTDMKLKIVIRMSLVTASGKGKP